MCESKGRSVPQQLPTNLFSHKKIQHLQSCAAFVVTVSYLNKDARQRAQSQIQLGLQKKRQEK